MGLFKKKIRFPSKSDVERKERAEERAEFKRVEREAYQEAFRKGRIERARMEGARAGSRRWYDAFADIGVSSGPVYSQPRVRTVSRKKSRRKSRKRRVVDDPFDMMPSYDLFDNHNLF